MGGMGMGTGTCESGCGDAGQACCEGGFMGGSCASGLECNDDDECEGDPCGAVGQACCQFGMGMGGGDPVCLGGNECEDDVCVVGDGGGDEECGGFGDPCCDGGECNGQLECNDDNECAAG
jgi:hypothetical protein